MAERQSATPVIMCKGRCTELSRITVTDRRVDEDSRRELARLGLSNSLKRGEGRKKGPHG
jgi:hypothetical protein